jgi:alkylation response protein AidB-like acyl-CoA dehydrogenase
MPIASAAVEERVATAHKIADDVLFPAALDVDRAPLVPQSHLDLLAHHGLYGLACHDDPRMLWAVTEVLASGCLATTFVWVQHHGAVRALAGSGNDALRYAWLRPLCDGERRAGIAIAGIRPPKPSLRAQRSDQGWLFDGTVPWVTGLGLIDVMLTGAVTDDDRVVWALLDALPGPALHTEPLPLIAANASGTVHATFDGHVVDDARVVAVDPYVPPPPDDGGGRPNGSLALGVARRACALMGGTPLDEELEERRRELDAATDDTMATARAAASELALRAAARLVVDTGSSAVVAGGDAERLLREAAFTAVFGTRRAIRDDLLRRLERRP